MASVVGQCGFWEGAEKGILLLMILSEMSVSCRTAEGFVGVFRVRNGCGVVLGGCDAVAFGE